MDGFKRVDGESETEIKLRMGRNITSILGMISGEYRPVLNRVLGALFGCTPDEVGQKSTREIAEQVMDSLNDEVLQGFFPQLRLWVPGASSAI